jgi:UDP-glucose 4-epimerase
MARTLFVTGATGLVGSHFLKAAASLPWDFRCLSRAPPSRSTGRLRWIRGDLREPAPWAGELRACDAIVHLATMSLTEVDKDPVGAVDVIVDSTTRLLKEGHAQGVRRFVMASTAEIYGSPRQLPIRETSKSKPLSLYGRLKADAELRAMRDAALNGDSLVILRFFNIYGLRPDGSLPPIVIRAFVERMSSGKPVVLEGARSNSRDFVHVSDACQALIRAVQRPHVSGAYNIGSGHETTLASLAHKIAACIGRKVEIEPRPHEGRSRRVVADVRRARRDLGYAPRISLEHGLREVLG